MQNVRLSLFGPDGIFTRLKGGHLKLSRCLVTEVASFSCLPQGSDVSRGLREQPERSQRLCLRPLLAVHLRCCSLAYFHWVVLQ